MKLTHIFTAHRIHQALTWIIRASLLVALIPAVFQVRYTIIFVTTLTLILTFIPEMIEHRYKIQLPIEFEAFVVLFIYMSIYLGEVHGYYEQFWWWDSLLHLGSGVALGFIGFVIMLVLNQAGKIQAQPSVLALFGFCFAMAAGGVWEIFEFAMDQLFLMNMQKGLVNTMSDLIADAVGGLLASIAGYFYLRTGKSMLLSRGLEKFVKSNPRIFNK